MEWGVRGDGVKLRRRGVGVSSPADRRGLGVYEACNALSVLKRIPSREVAKLRAAGDIEAIL